jgi:c-di-GMP-binding flagellar brake protein YcgR
MPAPYHEFAVVPGLAPVAPRSFRYTTNISVLAALVNHGKQKKLPSTVLRNISSTGAGIVSKVTLPIGEIISLHFYMPESGLPFRALAHVIWSDSQGQCGVRFQEVSELHLRRLQVWLADKAAEQRALNDAVALPLGASILES